MSGQDWATRSDEVLAALTENTTDLAVVASPLLPIRPPAVVLLPPTFTWGAFGDGEPDGFTAPLAIVVSGPEDHRALEELLRLVPLVVAAVEAAPDAIVTRATPGAFVSSGTGTTPLPAYFLECSL